MQHGPDSAPQQKPAGIDAILPLLRTPGGGEPLERTENGALAGEGRTYAMDGVILRMLTHIDPLLAKELEAQACAIDEYLDPRLLMPHYERTFVAKLAIEELLPSSVANTLGLQALDVGCGVGLLGRLYPRIGWVGLDASIDLLRKVTTGYRLLIEGSAELLPFPSASFDLIVALNMLHHVINPERAMAEFARVLKPGGTLIAVDPRKVWPIELGKKLVRSNDAAFAETHKAFTIPEYRTLLSANGAFHIDRFERVGLLGLVGMGGLDATRLSYLLPSAEGAVSILTKLDEALFKLPGVSRCGLNIGVRASRTAR